MVTTSAVPAVAPRRGWPWPSYKASPGASGVALVLGALCLLLLLINVHWIVTHRSAPPMDIDEAGYLRRAIDHSELIRSSVTGWWEALRMRDLQAPLLPVTTGTWLAVFGGGVGSALVSLQLFYAALIVGTYLMARGFVDRPLAAVAALVVACVPGVIDSSRMFHFAVPAAAFVAMTLACQVRSRAFVSLAWSVSWGACLGLTLMSRTMTLGLLPGLAAGALLALASSVQPGRSWRNALLGVTVGVLVAAPWYQVNADLVRDYLLGFGYGADAASYGAARPLHDFSTWLFRGDLLTRRVLYAPLTVTLILCIIVGVGAMLRRSVGDWRCEAARGLRKGPLQVAAAVVVMYVVLTTTRNAGSAFELPLVAPLVVLSVTCVARAAVVPRSALLAALLGAALLSVLDKNDVLTDRPRVVALSVEGQSYSVLDNRDSIEEYATSFFAPAASSEAALSAWRSSAKEVANFAIERSRTDSRVPVVGFAIQDPFLNPSSIQLEARLAGNRTLLVSLLSEPTQGVDLVTQLTAPQYGQPTVLVTGTAPPNREFRVVEDQRAVETAAARSGFHRMRSLRLPDGRWITLWFRDPAAATAGPP